MAVSTIDNSGISASAAISTSKLGTGAVLQVVQSITTATITTTSTSPQQSTLTVTITPTSATSKMLLMLNGGNSFNDALGSEVWYLFGRNIGGGGYTVLNSNQQYGINRQANGSSNGKSQTSNCYLDSPATTSSIVYQPYFQVNTGGSGTAYFNQGTIAMTFTVMEIAG